MAMSAVIDLPCGPKQSLGGGDPDAGTRALIGLLRARDQAAFVRAAAERDGRDPAAATVNVVTVTPDGRQDRAVSLPELELAAAGLDAIAPDCATCPVNRGGLVGGCVGVIHYPIPRSAEAWLLDRVQPPDTLGGFLLLRAVADFKYDGSAVKSYRERKLFEADAALTRPLPSNEFGATRVSSDQLFHALLGVGPKLNPWHQAMFLCWFGALGVDGAIPATPDQFEALINLPVADRPARARPNLGEPSADPGERAMQGLLYRLCVAWAHDQTLVVDA